MQLDSVTKQLALLATDLPQLRQDLREQLEGEVASLAIASLQLIYIVGSGDSLFAGLAARQAFADYASLSCRCVPAYEFSEYELPNLNSGNSNNILVIGISASGQSRQTTACLEVARQQGAMTLAITGNPSSNLAKAASRVLTAQLQDNQPAPGIRTYQASLLALLLLAMLLGYRRKTLSVEKLSELQRNLDVAQTEIARQAQANEAARAIAATISDSATLMIAGSGPNFGTACYGASKFVEISGCLALASDLEEWWHVGKFASYHNTPLLIVGERGRAVNRAKLLEISAAKLNWPVMSSKIKLGSEIVVDEALSPLVEHPLLTLSAYWLARYLDRTPFTLP